MNNIPKILWQFWSGPESILNDCIITRTAMQSWKNHLDGWDVRLVTLDTLHDWIDDWDTFYNQIDPKYLLGPKDRHLGFREPHKLADCIRKILLSKYGGLYTDVDVMCTSLINTFLDSLDTDFHIPVGSLKDISKAKSIKYSMDRSDNDAFWSRGCFENWLICASKGHNLLDAWLDKCKDKYFYIKWSPINPYFWSYEALGLTLNDNPDLNKYIIDCANSKTLLGTKVIALSFRSFSPQFMSKCISNENPLPHGCNSRWPRISSAPYFKLKRSTGTGNLKIERDSILDKISKL